MTDNLHGRYQAAHTAYREHRTRCTNCTDTSRCPDGQRLYESFERLQDAYLAQQKQKRS